MIIVQVHVNVKPDCIAQFIEVTLENARQSIQETGIARFDVIQEQTNPTNFLLVEVYREEAALGAHKDTAHYVQWRDRVADMMAIPRSSVKYHNLYPDDAGDW